MRRLTIGLFSALVVALVTGAAPAVAATHTKSFDFPVTMSPYEVKQRIDIVQSPRVDGYITAMKVNVVNADGTPVPINRLMLHHIVFASIGRSNPACQTSFGFDSKPYPYGGYSQLFYGAGEERNALVLPPGYGYPIKKNDIWAMVWMFMNHRGVDDHAFIRWTVTWQDKDANLTPVTPYWLDVRNCHADPVYDVPGGGKKGSVNRQTYDFRMPESGRIVAGGGHVHGGAKDLVVSEPDCANRKVFTSHPAWGMPSNPFYHVRPILHEPGPISMSGWLSRQGYPIAQGQRVRLTSEYDNQRPHTRVMGISMVYVAPDKSVTGCAPPPTDGVELQPAALAHIPYRTKAPRFTVPLTLLGPDGKAHKVKRPPGRTVRVKSGATVPVNDFFFGTATGSRNLSVTSGSQINWSFGPKTIHNVTLANGPRGFSSPNLNDGRSFSFKFKKAGTYRLFCALHPVEMIETVTVRPRKKH